MMIEEIKSAIKVKPYFKETAGVIYNCDCLDLLKQIPNKSIDLIITSPPYNMGGKSLGYKPRSTISDKHLELPKYFISNFSKETDIILDPFLGSGTTAVACKELYRKYIGVEISKKYCDMAVNRLRQEILL